MLPKIDTPIFSFTQPSTGKDIRFRPFVVKEEKILMLANDGGEPADRAQHTGEADYAGRLPGFDHGFDLTRLFPLHVGEHDEGLEDNPPHEGVTGLHEELIRTAAQCQRTATETNSGDTEQGTTEQADTGCAGERRFEHGGGAQRVRCTSPIWRHHTREATLAVLGRFHAIAVNVRMYDVACGGADVSLGVCSNSATTASAKAAAHGVKPWTPPSF